MSTETRLQSPPGTMPELSSLARVMRFLFLGITMVLTAIALLQFFLAGLGMFDAPARWADHANNGHIFGFITYIVWLPAVLGKMGRKVIIGSIVIFVLAHLQYPFMEIDSGIVNALHPLNGSLILVLSVWLTGQAIASVRNQEASGDH